MHRWWILAASAVAVISRNGGQGGPLVLIEGPVAGAVERPDSPPEALWRTAPDSPLDAKLAGISGTVLIQACIGTDGHADRLDVIRSRGALDAPALEAVREWRFRPASKDGEPIETWIAIPIEFFLAGDPVMHPLALIWPPAEPLTTPAPPWPESSRAPESATLEALVRKDGRVGKVKVSRAPPGVEKGLVGAIKRWTFAPAKLDGVAVDVWVRVEVGAQTAGAIPAREGSP
jgi:protein TonB